MESEPTRVLVVDDERPIRELLEIGLGQAGFNVRTAADGTLGLAAVREWEPDAIVLDVMMPRIDGITLLPMLRKITEAPILMLSAKGDVVDKVEGLAHGADDYLAKPFEIPELVARIQSALRRPTLAKRSTLSFSDLTVSIEDRIVTRGGKRIDLSAREFDLLAALLKSPNRVFSRAQLLDLVWGIDRDVTLGTVETYICYLRAKIDRGQPPLIHTIRGVGYSLREG